MRCHILAIALCVLVPLASSALETCEKSLVKAALSEPQLERGILVTLRKGKFWFCATSTEEVDSRERHREVQFGEVNGNSISGDFVYRDSNKTAIFTQTNTYTLVNDHVVTDENVIIHFFKCSKNLIGGLRCRGEDCSAGGTKYFVLAPWDVCDAAAEAEFDTCTKAFMRLQPNIKCVRYTHP